MHTLASRGVKKWSKRRENKFRVEVMETDGENVTSKKKNDKILSKNYSVDVI